ncbi:hypothetical protein I5168_11995 [Nonlabens sp. SCSIO 43208]|uniref:hypothetical protein n=1 Tax=Nonlabens sp. SCSIO 43208 TaxID=2793009 RepID=UPI003D6B26DE
METKKVKWEFRIRTDKFYWFHYARSLHSYTDTNEVTYHFRFLWWYLQINKVGRTVLKKYL